MFPGRPPTAPPPIDDVAAEPIEAVLARLARLAASLDEVTLAGCERWLIDAQRATGWLAVTRLQFERIQWELELARRFPPSPDDDAAGAGTEAGKSPTGPGPADDPNASDARASPDSEAKPGMSPVDAPGRTSRREQARERKLQQAIDLLASFSAKLKLGELTKDHVLALNTIRNRAVAREREAEILAAALERTAEDFAVWLCTWDAFLDLERHGDLTARQKIARKLQLFDRTNDFRGTLAPADFDAFKRTLQAIDAELQRRRDPSERVSWDQRMADALVEMTHRARGTGTGANSDAGSLRTAVVVLIDLNDLLAGTGHGTTADGSIVDVGEVRRMAATEHVIPMVLGADSVVLDMGRARRYADDAQWLALLARDGGCVLCDAPLGTLDAHHTPHWHNGGNTDLCTMCLCCTRCHRRIHAEHINLTFTDGRVRAHKPDGTPIPTRNRTDRRLPTAARPGAPPGTTHAA